MIGAIIGDIIGSPYEHGRYAFVLNKNFPSFRAESTFTDDSVLTCATAKVLNDGPSKNSYKLRFARAYKDWGTRYTDRGYGSKFKEWMAQPKLSVNNSYANGCIMRCSPIAAFYEDYDTAIERGLQSIAYTHNSPESARGVQSIISAIHMAYRGHTKADIKAYVEEQYGHMLNRSLLDLRTNHSRDIRCNIAAPQALTCFLLSDSYESAIQNAVYIRGDTDTNAAIAGSIAEAYYGVRSIPTHMIAKMMTIISIEMVDTINDFYENISHLHPEYKSFRLSWSNLVLA